MPASPCTEVSSPHVDAWMLTPPRVPGDSRRRCAARHREALSEIGATAARAGVRGRVSAPLLVKMLAVTNAAPAVDLDGRSHLCRCHNGSGRAFYLEIMQYRRAVLRDVDAGAARD